MVLCFTVYGVAQPKGSMKAYVPRGMKFPIVTDSNRSVKAWSQLVAEGASRALQALPEAERQLLEGGVRLTVAFYLPRPKSLPRKIRTHCKAPDLDKCARSVLDSLTQVVYRDDAQVVELFAVKRYAAAGELPCATIRVEEARWADVVAVPVVPAAASLFAEA